MQHFDGELEKYIREGVVDFEAALGFATNAGNMRLEMQDYLEDPRNRKKPASNSDSLLSELMR
jgi:Tfp pilus assembly ATPase PilU